MIKVLKIKFTYFFIFQDNIECNSSISPYFLMDWTRIYIFFHLTVLTISGAEHSLCRIWSQRESVVRVGEYLFCSCNNAEKPTEIRIITYPIVDDINITIVDNKTIKTKVTDSFEKTEIFTCGCPEKFHFLTAINTLHVIPLLDVKDFDCFVREGEGLATCHFTSVGSWKFRQKRYSVIANFIKTPCMEVAENDTKVMCTNIPVDYRAETINVTLEMEYHGDKQTKKFDFEIRNIIESSLVPLGVKIAVNNTACLFFNYSRSLIYPYRCVWNMIPLNSNVAKREDAVTNCIRECPVLNCMKEPLKAFQPYLFNATCGYVSSSRKVKKYKNYYLCYVARKGANHFAKRIFSRSKREPALHILDTSRRAGMEWTELYILCVH